MAAANATTPGAGPVFAVGAHANGSVGSTTIANATTNIGGNVPALMTPFNSATTPNTFAFATGLPNAASVTSALVGHPNNTAVWTQPTAFVAGAGLLGAVFNGTPGVAHSYMTQTDYSFAVPSGKGSSLTVGLLNGLGFGTLSGNDSLSFEVTDNGLGIAPLATSFPLPAGATLSGDIISFNSIAAATAFFSDDVLTFGTLSGTNTIGVDLNLTAADPVGFQGNFLVGTAGPAGGGGGGAVPEPGTLAVFLTALLGWFGINRFRQQKSGGGGGARMA
jgi:hypothetical protein